MLFIGTNIFGIWLSHKFWYSMLHSFRYQEKSSEENKNIHKIF